MWRKKLEEIRTRQKEIRNQLEGGEVIAADALERLTIELRGLAAEAEGIQAITFQYYKLRCAVAISVEMDTMALSAFEATLINNVVEAMTKGLERAIISGSGTGQPKGILTETPVAAQIVTVTAPTYQALLDAESALPQAYENGAVWCMSKTTYMKFYGLLDSNGQPVGRCELRHGRQAGTRPAGAARGLLRLRPQLRGGY
jgi:hypothetical protein